VKKAQEAARLPDSSIELLAGMTDKQVAELMRPLLQLVMETCDEIASGHNTWVSIGSTKEKTSFVISSRQLMGTVDVYAKDVITLLSLVPELL